MVSANTSSGKTEIAEMFMAQEIRQNGGKAIYLSPYKALSQEKFDKWQEKDNHFSDLKISICTGDYQITPSRKQELENADVIVMTYEILNSISRSRSDKCDFLKGNITLVMDESHFCGDRQRGSHIEVGLLNFVKLNPSARIIALSATLPNYKEIGRWLSNITQRETYVLKSDFRPCILHKSFESLKDKGMSYAAKETNKVNKAIAIVKKYSQDKFILFVHTKKTGIQLLESLTGAGIPSSFHSADLNNNDRMKLEKYFKDGNLRVLVATSTLSAGVNTPAKRVVILGVHRGITEIDVESIGQEAGRAGRPQYVDNAGYAHILLPENRFKEWKYKIENPPDIKSSLILNEDFKSLAFHVVSEIHHKIIQNREDLYNWFKMTLAYHQNQSLNEDFIDDMLDSLKKNNILTEENGVYNLTSLGKISSMFYYNPFDVNALSIAFNKLFKNNQEMDDHSLSISLANTDTNRCGIASAADMDECQQYIQIMYKKKVDFDVKNNAVIKMGFCNYLALTGRENPVLSSALRGVQYDFGRTLEVLNAIDSMHNKWNKLDWFNQLKIRMTYGVGWDLTEICKVKGIGTVKANKLWKAGLKNLKDIYSNPDKVKSTLNCSAEVLSEILTDIKDIEFAQTIINS